MNQPDRLAVGRILRPHGVRGDLLVDPYSETIRSLEPKSKVFVGSNETAALVISARNHRGKVIVRLEGYRDRESAEGLRGAELFVAFQDAEPLPAGVYYRWQILGLSVRRNNGEHLGTVEDILETGANDVYVVRSEGNAELLLPAIESVILEVDLDGGQLIVNLLEGLI